MNSRRKFLKLGALFIFAPKLIIAQGLLAKKQSVGSLNQRVVSGGGGPPAWQNLIDPGSTDTDNPADVDVLAFPQIVNNVAGTASKLRVYSTQNAASGTLKMALYAADKTLLSSGSASVSASIPYNDWIEVDITPVAVSAATTYYIGFASSANSLITARSDDGVGVLLYKFANYSTFPPDPIAESGTYPATYAVGIYVTP